jgi:1-acyl-sn-glycerol-3-phosphate acyltransferase
VILYRTIGNGLVRPLLHLLYRVDGTGWNRIPAAGGAVVAASHDSLIDPFVLGAATPRVIHYMAKAELWRYPLLRRVVAGFGAFPVRRGAGDAAAVEYGRHVLARGELVGMFPQGTCRPLRERPWRRGAARLAKEAGVPLVPVCLVNTERAIRPHRLKVGLPQVHVHVAEPLDTSTATVDELTAEAERRVEELRRPYGPPAHAWLDRPPVDR